MQFLLLIFTLFCFSSTKAQSGKGPYQYTDDKLSKKSKTYLAGQYHFSLGFDFNWEIANKMADLSNKVNLVFCKETGTTLTSYRFRDEQGYKYVTTLGIMLAKNYNLIIVHKPGFTTKVETAEISIFYEQDGILYNYPNKEAKNSISGKMYKVEELKDRKDNTLQKISFENGSYLILKDHFYLYALKLDGINCEFKIDDY